MKMSVLSYGAGVNSTAILALIKLGRLTSPDRIVFCDTGAERVETYCYLKFATRLFPSIEIALPRLGSLVSYCQRYRIIPARMTRWCTLKFKVDPFRRLLADSAFTKILGICYDERNRVRDFGDDVVYPLIDLKLTRRDCVNIIKEVGWEVPRKSGCFICPFMRKTELIDLYRCQPEQWNILVQLEAVAHARNPKIFFRSDRLLPEFIKLAQLSAQEQLDGFENYQHCLCKFD